MSEKQSRLETVQDPVDLPRLVADEDLATILGAWQTATDRLQRTHEALRQEVHRLTQELETKNRELARKDRLADLGQMASHVAHEVRNSIVPLKLYLSLLHRHTTDYPVMDGLVGKISSGFGNLETTVNDLLHFTSDREPGWASIDLASLVDDVLESIDPHLRDYEIEVDAANLESIRWTADESMLRRALINLMLNAVDAMSQGGTLSLSSVVTSRGLELEVADSGAGIDPQILHRLFDPFVSTKATGTGLGLSIVERIAAAHGGHVEACNCAEGGAAFTICLPEYQASLQRAA